MHAAAIQLLKQLSGAVRPQLRPSPRGARPVRLLGQNGGRWGRGEGVPLHPETPHRPVSEISGHPRLRFLASGDLDGRPGHSRDADC